VSLSNTTRLSEVCRATDAEQRTAGAGDAVHAGALADIVNIGRWLLILRR
jgi:hypothetical protein